MGISTSYYISIFYTGLLIILLRINHSESQRPYQDVALFKPATQIGTYQNNVTAYGPQWATDGLVGDNDPYSFIDSGDDNTAAWWKVDLQSDCIIKYVGYQISILSGRNIYLETLRVTIETADGSVVECGTYDSTGKNATYLFLSCNSIPAVTGRKVIFSRNGGYQPRYMAATEFFVHGIFLFGNQALQKPTNQSYKSYTSPPSDNTLAVDKNFLSCSQTRAPEEEMPWWQVDLQMYISVESVRVFVSDTNQYNIYFQDVEITVDNTSTITSQNICTRYNRPPATGPINVTLPCNNEITGRFVTFRRMPSNSSTNRLVLCDVQVIGRFIGELSSTIQPVTNPPFSSPTISSTTSLYTPTNSPTSTTSPYTTTNSPISTTSLSSTYSTAISSATSSPTSTTLSYATASSPITSASTSSSPATTTSQSSTQNTMSYSVQRTSSGDISSVTINSTRDASSQGPENKGLHTGYIILIAVLAAVFVIILIGAAFFIGRSKACNKGSPLDAKDADNQMGNKKELEPTSYYSEIKDADVESRSQPPLSNESSNPHIQSNVESRSQPRLPEPQGFGASESRPKPPLPYESLGQRTQSNENSMPNPPLPYSSLNPHTRSNVENSPQPPLPYESLAQQTQSNENIIPNPPLPYESLVPQTQSNGNTNVPLDNMYGSHGYVEMGSDSTIEPYSSLNQRLRENGYTNEKLKNRSRNTIYAQTGRNSTSSHHTYGSSGIGSDLDGSDHGIDAVPAPIA